MPSVFQKPVGEDSPGTVKEAIGYGTFNVLFFLMLSYPGASFLRELLGWSGLATTPLIAAAVLWPVSVAIVYAEPRLHAQVWWPKVSTAWTWGCSVLYTFPPPVLALTFPLAVGNGWPTGVPTLISLLPVVALFGFFVARRRWRDRAH
ncbi:hypothetical protein [Streptomyces sp. NPDC046261]|uniref:hypothetical protein n=1 Tax=Streptomyces sp. NPDC046261 TaxID=3157200 RepID=UPI0033D5A370